MMKKLIFIRDDADCTVLLQWLEKESDYLLPLQTHLFIIL